MGFANALMFAESKKRRSAIHVCQLGIIKDLIVAFIWVWVTAGPTAPSTAGGTSRAAGELPPRLLGEFA